MSVTLGALADPAWVEQHRHDADVVLIDIAGMGQDNLEAYNAGHVPGAHVWEWKEALWDELKRDFPAPEEFARRCGAAGISNDTRVVFYGEGVQFGVYAWWAFRYCGHRNVYLLDGARHRWKAEGRPLVTDVPPRREGARYTPVARDERMRVMRDEVLASLGNEGVTLLDARSPEEYGGQRVGGPGGPDVGAVRAGRIPGARHLYFEDLLTVDKAFKPVREIERLVRERGASREKDVIAYCRMSHRATVLYFALTELLGYTKVRAYDGSWTEWGNLVGVPIER